MASSVRGSSGLSASDLAISDPHSALIRARRDLRNHIGLGSDPGDPPSSSPPEVLRIFFVEVAPYSQRGARCKLLTCGKCVEPGCLRIAVSPGMGRNKWSGVDCYHIRCFEDIADFSQDEFIRRVEPLTRNTWMFRGLAASTIFDGNYLVPGGIERLILEWKVTRGKQIDERDGCGDQTDQSLDPEFDALLHRAGSAMYTPRMPKDMDVYEYRNLLVTLAPVQSDGPDDNNEWDLFDRYLRITTESLADSHDLSAMIERWEADVSVAIDGDQNMDTKEIRALKRLSAIPMPRTAFDQAIYG